jgi:hypothetical protein
VVAWQEGAALPRARAYRREGPNGESNVNANLDEEKFKQIKVENGCPNCESIVSENYIKEELSNYKLKIE